AGRDMTQVSRGGQIRDVTYDAAGRLDELVLADRTLAYAYDPSSGRLASITDSDGNAVAFTRDGPLVTAETWTGPVNGSVARELDSGFRVTSISVADDAIGFAYDGDGLLVQAGAFGVTRHPEIGFVQATALGEVTTT